MSEDARTPNAPKVPVVYECGCAVVVVNEAWWRPRLACPEHGQPIRPVENEATPEHRGEPSHFWFA